MKPLNILLKDTAQASFNTPYTHHMDSAVNMIKSVLKSIPSCSLYFQVVLNCGSQENKPMQPAIKPRISIEVLLILLPIFNYICYYKKASCYVYDDYDSSQD